MCFLRLSFVYHRSSVCFVLLCYLFSDSHLIHLIHLFSQATQYIQHDQVCLRLDDCAIDVEPFTFIFSLASGLFSLFSLSRLFLHFKHHMVDYWRSAMLGIIFVIAHTRNEKKHTLIMTMLRCTLRKIVYVISLHRLRCHLHAWNLQFRRVFNAFVIRQHFTRLLAIGTMISEVSHRSRNWINFEWKKKHTMKMDCSAKQMKIDESADLNPKPMKMSTHCDNSAEIQSLSKQTKLNLMHEHFPHGRQ